MFDFTSERIGERPIAIEQSERRPGGSPLNQEEFRLKRGRNCLNLGREVLSDLREMRIEDPNDCGWKLLEFVWARALSRERFETALGYSERAGHRNLTVFPMKDLDQH